jgi:hypothetical protein
MTGHVDEGTSAALHALARDAQRLLARGGPEAEIGALSRRIDVIRGRVCGPAPTPLARWLDSLQQRIDRPPVGIRGRTPRGTGAARGATSCR